MKILVLDNYDSFTYNLVHLLEKLSTGHIDVFRNDKISLAALDKYDKILLSPGPGLPAESGILMEAIKKYHETKSIFGVCLGLQAMAECFGGKLLNLPHVVHGIATPVKVSVPSDPLFSGIPNTFMAGRYHSWVAEKESLPSCFSITAESDDGHIMAIRHNISNLSAVQFHPESILTEFGAELINNWLNH